MIAAIAALSRWLALVAIAVAAIPAAAQTGAAPSAAAATDGRLYGHIPYAEADASDLVSAPAGFAVGQQCLVRPAMLEDLKALVKAANKASLEGDLKGISCFRTIAHQQRIFCESGRPDDCVDPERRAISVAPPGHSEHATGYAIDFGTRPSGGCADVENCFANTAAGHWLIINAPDYGFELSFPRDNPQGVTWEPWHWRWVGTSNSEPGAAEARAVFARARQEFLADPRIPDIVVHVIAQPPVPEPEVEPIEAAPAPVPDS